MRIHLLTLSLIDRVLYALNLKTNGHTITEADEQRSLLLGDDASIREQTHRSRGFAEEVAERVRNDPPSRWWNRVP